MVELGNFARRVKVYRLSDTGQWDDRGTGFVQYRHSEGGDSMMLTVKSEETPNEVLLEHKIDLHIEYQRQGDTIITWCDESGVDLALSFQDQLRCNEVWDQMMNVQEENRISLGGEDSVLNLFS